MLQHNLFYGTSALGLERVRQQIKSERACWVVVTTDPRTAYISACIDNDREVGGGRGRAVVQFVNMHFRDEHYRPNRDLERLGFYCVAVRSVDRSVGGGRIQVYSERMMHAFLEKWGIGSQIDVVPADGEEGVSE